jgi:hypothetical protein
MQGGTLVCVDEMIETRGMNLKKECQINIEKENSIVIMRKRLYYLILVIVVIILGLLSRDFFIDLPKCIGDILWGAYGIFPYGIYL